MYVFGGCVIGGGSEGTRNNQWIADVCAGEVIFEHFQKL
jgi:hypothetical protein